MVLWLILAVLVLVFFEPLMEVVSTLLAVIWTIFWRLGLIAVAFIGGQAFLESGSGAGLAWCIGSCGALAGLHWWIEKREREEHQALARNT